MKGSNKPVSATKIILGAVLLYTVFTFNIELFTLGQNIQGNPLAYTVSTRMIEMQGTTMDMISFKIGYHLG